MGIYNQKDRKGNTRYVVSKYWPEKSGRIRFYMPNMALAKQLVAKIDHSIISGTWRELKAELAGEKEVQEKEETEETFSSRFIEERCKPRMRTWYDYERSLQKVLQQIGSVPVLSVRRSHVMKFVGARRKEVTAASVNREVAALKSMLTYAVDMGLMEFNPLIRFKMLPEQKKAFHVLTHEEVNAVIDEIRSPLSANMVGVIAETAIRIEEAVNLLWADIDYANKVLTLPKTKNYETRKIPLSEKAIAHLKSVLRYIGNPWVWAKGQQSRFKCPRKGFDGAVRRAGIPKIGFHDLRRYRATQWHKYGLEVRVISEL
jgi:integrase